MSNPTQPMTRRQVLADVGRGMFVAGLGAGLSRELGLAPAWAADDPGRLTFGSLEPLAAFIQETPPDRIIAAAVGKLRSGTDLRDLVAAAALANARAFGGEDYVGFHTLMALAPAYHMAAEETSPARRPLAVLKVLARNSGRLAEANAHSTDTLKPVAAESASSTGSVGERVRECVRRKDGAAAERAFAALAADPPERSLDAAMVEVADAVDVHRIVMVSRSWDLLGLVGRERAHTLLRQSVRYCAKNEPHSAAHSAEVRDLLPKLLDQYMLTGKPAARRTADDAWGERFADTLFAAAPAQAADAAAAALAEGFDPDAIGEAISLTANQLVLRDRGRPKEWASANKPVGSVHGDSVGVHACDAVNAWRAVARVGDGRTRATALILAAYHAARDRSAASGRFGEWEPYPTPEHMERVAGVPRERLSAELSDAIRDKDQGRAAALARRLGTDNADPAEVFAVCREFAVSQDGALHAEKFYRTTVEDFSAASPKFRWRRLEALARVTASAYGYEPPGYKEACERLGSG